MRKYVRAGLEALSPSTGESDGVESAAGRDGSTTFRLGSRGMTFVGVPLPNRQPAPVSGDGWVRFVQTTGGRTGLPAPRHGVATSYDEAKAVADSVARRLGIDEVAAEVLPADKAAAVAGFQQRGHRVAMVGDGVNDAPALAQADLGIAIGAGTDVAIETADVVLMRSDPLDVAMAITIGRGTLRKMRQNLGWAVGYNAIALPIAAGVFQPAFGLVLRPEIAALSMSGSSFLVAVNALLLKRLKLPAP